MAESGSGPSLAEIGRQVREALGRLESLAGRLDQNFVPNRILELYKEIVELRFRRVEQDISQINKELDNKADESDVTAKPSKTEVDDLRTRVSSLEDNQKWLVRVVLGALVLALVGLVLAAPGSLLK